MPWWTWISLGVFGLAVVAGGVFAVSAFRFLKEGRAAAERLQARVDEVMRAAEELERRMEHAAERAEDFERHRGKLSGSLERFSVLTWALSDARRDVDRLRESFLRK